MTYQRVQLANTTLVGRPGPLPPELAGLDDAWVADLGWVGEPLDGLFRGAGYWPVSIIDPSYDATTETVTSDIDAVTCDPETKRCTALYGIRRLTDDERAARQPKARPLPIIDFVALVQTVAGLTDERLVEASEDRRLRALWLKLNLVREAVERDHAVTRAGLKGLTDAGYITADKAAAVLAAWPTEQA